MTKLAPIVLFAYNRPHHVRQTIQALQQNSLASESLLFIYSDGCKGSDDKGDVWEVRNYIKSITGFKEITIFEQKKNLGLAQSIVTGVTNIVNQYGKIIVLEDDIVVSPVFLSYMNQALDHFSEESKVWHVSGWNYPIESKNQEQSFLWRTMNCWGWGTWADRWAQYDNSSVRIIDNWTSDDIYRFNLDGYHDFYSQILENNSGSINTWAIFWYATIFQHNALCLNPEVSYVYNIGFDGTGEHCNANHEVVCEQINVTQTFSFPADNTESENIVRKIQSYYKKQRRLDVRIYRKLKAILSVKKR